MKLKRFTAFVTAFIFSLSAFFTETAVFLEPSAEDIEESPTETSLGGEILFVPEEEPPQTETVVPAETAVTETVTPVTINGESEIQPENEPLQFLESYEGFEYSADSYNKTVTIKGYSGDAQVLEIPDTIGGMKVTAIADYAFRDNKSLKSIDLGSVAYLGYYIFSGCTSLTDITIPNTVRNCNYSSYCGPLAESSIETVIFEEGFENIPAYICSGAKNLKSVTIPEKPDNLEGYRIGDYAFANSGLEEITIPDTILDLGSGVFSNCMALKKVNFSTDLKTIGNSCFAGCTALTEFTVPNGVTSLGSGVFSGCKYLDRVTIGTKVQTIGNNCFSDCIRLKTVNMGKNVKELGSSAFSGCISLSSLDFANIQRIGSYALDGCTKITSIKLGSKAESVGDYAFSNLENLTDIDLGGVTYLGYYIFNDCVSLTDITIPSTVTRCNYSSYCGPLAESSIETVIFEDGFENIPAYICSGAKNLKSVTIPEKPDNLEGYKIGDYAFANSGLEEITIPDTVLDLGSGVFSNCTALKKVNFSTDLKTIGNSCFAGCTALTEFTVPNGVTSLGSGAFSGCKYLNKITTGTKVQTIGNNCFSDCIRLKTVNMGKNVKELGSDAFSGCISLSSLDFANIETIGSDVLYGCTKITSIKLGENAKNIGDYAFAGLENLMSIDLGGAEYLGYCIFSNSPNLAGITIPDTVTRCSYSSYRGPLADSNIAVVRFESGMTEIPSYICSNAENLITAEIPSTVKKINSYAFAYCPKLANIDSPRKSFEFFPNSFYSDNALNDSRFTALDMKHTFMQVNSVETYADGTVNFTVKYAVNPSVAQNANDFTFELSLPDNVNLLADSVKSDDVTITGDNLTAFSVSDSEGSFSFSARISELGEYNVSAYLSFYSNSGQWREKIGSVDISCPDITISAPKTTNSTETQVHGLAERGENVYIYVNGVKSATLVSNRYTGKYSGSVKLPSAKTGTEYEIYAVCGSSQSESVYTLYDTGKPTVKKVTMHYNNTESLDVTDVFTEGVSPVISLVSGAPVNFTIETANSRNIYRMFVTSTKGNEVKYLEAFYDRKTDKWKTDGYFDPYNTSYIPASLNISIFEADVTEMKEKDAYRGLALEDVPQEFLDNSSCDILYEDSERQLVGVNLSDGRNSVEYTMLTGETDSMYIDGKQVSKAEILSNPKKYNAVRAPYEVINNDGTKSIFYEISQKSTDARLQYQSMMMNVVDSIADVGGSDHPIGTAVLRVIEGENADNPECVLINNVVSNADTIYDIARGAYDITSFGDAFGAGEVLSIAGDTVNLGYRLSLPGADSDVARAAVACWACKVGVTVLGAALAATGPVGWAIAFAAGILVTNLDNWLWKDFTDTQQFDSTSPRFMRFVVDPSGIVYDGETDNPVEDAMITVYRVDDSGSRTLWDAGEYEQKNPLYTDRNGYYACDVPEGHWIVVCSVAGYKDIESEIFSVPPEKTELNFDISSYESDSEVKGDANLDGKVSISDAVYILQYLANSDKFRLSSRAKTNADVDGSAGVTGKDAAVIQLYDAGIVTSLPIK